ncbi:hypothetical protein TrVE_jg10072 [Triparma verrucosa]|uniref:Uncharacterized protein n=1 Tax=Triparma verrucosa TaxID=1606542 RepID=A0A9W7CCI4_9STRA|nr:hypothetical protein TrVE_jg10072 [Triparma verrucosa]
MKFRGCSIVREVCASRADGTRTRASGRVFACGTSTITLRCDAALGTVIARYTWLSWFTLCTKLTSRAGSKALVGGATFGTVTTSGAGASTLISGATFRTVVTGSAGASTLISGAASGTVTTSGAGASALVSGATFRTVSTGCAGAGTLVSGAASGTVTTSSAGASTLVSGAASGTVTTNGAGAGALVGGTTFVNLRVTYNDTLPLLLPIFAGLPAPTSHLSLFELLKVPPVHGTQASFVSP